MAKKFIETDTDISGLTVVKRIPVSDNRGRFERVLCVNEISSWRDRSVKQINRSVTKLKGVIRGLHFQQKPYSECKLVTCLKGSVMDVALDLRTKSPTYGKIFSIELNQNNEISLLIPEGFAHGFQTLSDNVEMLYIHSTEYSEENECGIDSLDHNLGINWPLTCTERSERDKTFQTFEQLKDKNVEV